MSQHLFHLINYQDDYENVYESVLGVFTSIENAKVFCEEYCKYTNNGYTNLKAWARYDLSQYQWENLAFKSTVQPYSRDWFEIVTVIVDPSVKELYT